MTPVAPRVRPEELSIVVQGRLNATDAAQVARHCRHWREQYPAAQIILSASGSDVMPAEDAGTLALRRASGRTDATVAAALAELADTVDLLVHAVPAAPLAPLKFGGAANNVNLQIAAARAGLAAAARPYTLRVRADLTLTGPLLDHYTECLAVARRPSILAQRVMICQLFTLDPYTVERLPFHYSDWFQLGATGDLRAMWAIGHYTAQDADYYRTHPHARYSNEAERGFQSRFGAEQYLALSWLRAHRPGLVMEWHNDLLSRREAMNVLYENFIIADPAVCTIDFPKYAHVIGHPFSDLLCVSHADWRHFATTDATDAAADPRDHHLAKHARFGSFPRGYDPAPS